ncbi:MAG: aromatic ring-hydroxylating dioxygenase subunit alpha [Chthoniobacterales bacterium]
MQAAAPGAFRKTTDTFTAGARTLPQRYFVSPEVFAEEREAIFARQWVGVGQVAELAAAGSFLVAEVAGESLLVTRDEGGAIRGFYNVCRHRGTRLCEERAGQAKVIQCPYHAWTYGLDGSLLAAPHMSEVPGFAKADYSLRSVRAEVWEGFVFVALAEAARPLAEVFAPLSGKFADWNLPTLRPARRIEYEVAANWKLIFENYSECYHCPGVHPMLAKVSPYDSAENDLVEGPFLGGFMKIAQGASLTMSGQACARPVGEVAASDTGRVFYYSIFPNLLLSMHPDYVMVHRIEPVAPGRTRVVCDWLFHPAAEEGADFRPEDAVEFWDITNRQDWRVCELSQQGIASRAYEPGPYSPRESIPAAWDREYRRHVG